MKKHSIFIAVFVVLLALLAIKFIFEKDQPSSRSAFTLMNNGLPKSQSIESESGVTPLRGPDNASSAEPLAKQSSGVFAGGRQWNLNFADESQPTEVRQRIGYDLNLVYGHLPKLEIDLLPKVDSMPFPLELDGRKFDRRVRFEGGENRRPKSLFENDFGLLEQDSGESSLFVSKSVVAAYIEAIQREKQNPEAYQQLDQFLVRMNELKKRPVENVLDFFVLAENFKSAAADLAAVTPAGFAEGWGGKFYREPSILDVTETAGTPLEKYGSLVATTYAMSSGKLDDLPLLLFTNGQWRFLLQRPPT